MIWLFNAVLMVLATVAMLSSLAAYRSPAVNGPEVSNHMRLVRAVAWMILLVYWVTTATHGEPPFVGVVLVVLTYFAFADALSYTDRFITLAGLDRHT